MRKITTHTLVAGVAVAIDASESSGALRFCRRENEINLILTHGLTLAAIVVLVAAIGAGLEGGEGGADSVET